MKEFFKRLFRDPDEVTPEELEGFDPTPPRGPETQIYYKKPVGQTPEASSGRSADQGIDLTRIPPGTDIPQEKRLADAAQAAKERTEHQAGRIREAAESVRRKMSNMAEEDAEIYRSSLEEELEEMRAQAMDLDSLAQPDLARTALEDIAAKEAEYQAASEFLEARKKAEEAGNMRQAS